MEIEIPATEADWKLFRFPTHPVGTGHRSPLSAEDVLATALGEDEGGGEDGEEGDGAPAAAPAESPPGWAIPPRRVGMWMCDPNNGSLVHLGLRRRIDLHRFKWVGQVAAFLNAIRGHTELDPQSMVEALTEAIWIFHQQSLEEFLHNHPEDVALGWKHTAPRGEASPHP